MATLNAHAHWYRDPSLPVGDNDNAPSSEPVDQNFYNSNAAVYEDDMKAFGYSGSKQTASTLHKYLQGRVDAKILDIGCGTGLVMQELREFAPYNNADGLDPSEEMLLIGKRNGLYNNTFHQCFTLDSDIPSESYEAVACAGGFGPGHIKGEAVTKMCEITKKGGYIVIAMRSSYNQEDTDLKKLRLNIQEMVESGSLCLIEESTFENYICQANGLRIVLQKL